MKGAAQGEGGREAARERERERLRDLAGEGERDLSRLALAGSLDRSRLLLRLGLRRRSRLLLRLGLRRRGERLRPRRGE